MDKDPGLERWLQKVALGKALDDMTNEEKIAAAHKAVMEIYQEDPKHAVMSLINAFWTSTLGKIISPIQPDEASVTYGFLEGLSFASVYPEWAKAAIDIALHGSREERRKAFETIIQVLPLPVEGGAK